ncbi:MAG: acyl carrier protein [Actinobacteria bacterium]|jgi:acyl carrier protein|nr:acyl carrier protein [Actinomycetota bacterium]NBR66852.1 acyl carrier protein [Actinomycetota bacterium]NBU16468.1 acyl carrier protein [Actinomycetota bacterium]
MAGIDRASVLGTVARHLADILETDASAITEDKSFVDDLGADSIALIELVDSLEQEFSATLDGFSFDDDELAQLKTVRDAVDYVMRAHGA